VGGVVGALRDGLAHSDRISDPRGGFVVKEFCCSVFVEYFFVVNMKGDCNYT